MTAHARLTYAKLHQDQATHIPSKADHRIPFESLLVFLEGAGLKNQNSQIRVGELLKQPVGDLISLAFKGQNYNVLHVAYPTSQQFARFSIVAQ